MIHPRCDVKVGSHPGPFWTDKEKNLKVCNRHKHQYEQDGRYGPFDWVSQGSESSRV